MPKISKTECIKSWETSWNKFKRRLFQNLFSAFSLKLQRFFSITRTIFAHKPILETIYQFYFYGVFRGNSNWILLPLLLFVLNHFGMLIRMYVTYTNLGCGAKRHHLNIYKSINILQWHLIKYTILHLTCPTPHFY